MKNLFIKYERWIIVLAALHVAWIICTIGDNKVKASNERIERINVTEIDGHTQVQVFHDRESGMELICPVVTREQATSSAWHGGETVAMTCVITQRNWK